MENNYITFTEKNNKEFILYTNLAKRTWDGILYYSVDTVNWSKWKGTIINSKNGKLFIRGYDNTFIMNPNATNAFSFRPADRGLLEISCEGNIKSLLHYPDTNTDKYQTVDNYAFKGLFGGSNALVDASKLILDVPILSKGCFAHMFYDCECLKYPPVIKTTKLAHSCFNRMFSFCLKLLKAPELPIAKLYANCYSRMFEHCEALEEMPDLPATNLATDCYENMFNNCKSLIKTKPLKADALKPRCYMNMFSECSNLIEAPDLLAEKLADGCYNAMFRSCTSLTKLPNISPTAVKELLASNSFNIPSPFKQEPFFNIFYACENLNLDETNPFVIAAKGEYRNVNFKDFHADKIYTYT